MISSTEENYLKAIFELSDKMEGAVSTNSIAALMNTSAASVTDMLKRLTEKGFTLYEKYKGVRLSPSGEKVATQLIRKQRLWETFMVEKLNFSWDEVHPVAEQLEHIQSEQLIDRLDDFLGNPKFDPHGDPIPDKEGNFTYRRQIPLNELPLQQSAVVVGVGEHSPAFLQFIEHLDLVLGVELSIRERYPYDGSLLIVINGKDEKVISQKVSQNLYVKI